MVLGGFIAGAIWGMLAVFPKAKWGVNETIITLLFNYIALLWVDFWVYGPWRDTTGPNLPFSPKVPSYAAFGTMWGSRVNTALFIGLGSALLMYFFFSKTVRGYQIRVIGANGKAARYAGMNVSLNIMLVMLMSGGLAGIAGVAQVGGAATRLQPDIAAGAGYTAIIIGYVAKFNPFIIILVSFLFGGLMQGSYSLQMAGMPWQMTQMLQGAILFCVLSGQIFSRCRVVAKWERCEGKSTKVQGEEGVNAC
jgi:simple sugar transport system permease protein